MRTSLFSMLVSMVGKGRQLRAKRKSISMRLNLETMEERILPALTWSAGVALPSLQPGDAAIKETDQSILVLGGGSTTVNQLAPGGTAWTTANPIDQARTSPAVVSIGGSELLVYGGTVGGALISSLIYDPAQLSNIHVAAPMSTPRSLLAFAGDGSNRAYAIGGIDGSGNTLASVERFDPTTGVWSLVAPLPEPLSGAAAVYDGAGHILVFGGATTGSSIKTALEYTVATDTWSTLAPLHSATTEAAAVFGPDGLIYVIGGMSSDGPLATVQAYNPATNTWSQDAPLPGGLADDAAVVDAQARIEVFGANNLDEGGAVSSVYVTQSLANVVPLFVTPTALPNATADAPYDPTITAIGSPAPTYTLVSGPTGLSIDPNSGVITWAPDKPQIGTTSVTVQAQNVAGTTLQTFTLKVTPDTTPPTVPVLSVDTITTTSSIPLSWTPSTDNVGVAGYRLFKYTPAVYRGHSGRGGGYTLVSPAKYTLLVDNLTTTSYTFTGLTPLTTYQYAVAAFDAAANQSGFSNVVSGTTLQTPTITYSSDGVNINPVLSVVANHALYITLWAGGSPAPSMSLISAPNGVVVTQGLLTNSQLTIVIPDFTWTPTASQVGVSDIILQAVNSVGTFNLDIPVTVTADVPVPSLTINGGLAYTIGNMTAVAGTPYAYQLAVNNGFDITGGTHPQYALSGTPFSFQFTGTSKTSPTTYALVSGPSTMTIDPNTGIGTWAPGAADAGSTTVTLSATNSAGTSLLTVNFPTYFTTAPTNVTVGFNTSASGSLTAFWTPVVTWTAPANAANVADYKVTVTNANTQVATVYDTHGTATSYSLPAGITGQNWVNVTAYDAKGNPSQTSTSNVPLYLAALSNLSWVLSSPVFQAGKPFSVQFTSSWTTYALVSGPAGATINSTTGLLSWTPAPGQVSPAHFVVSATNNNGWGTVYANLTVPPTPTVNHHYKSGSSNPNASGSSSRHFTKSSTTPTLAAKIVGLGHGSGSAIAAGKAGALRSHSNSGSASSGKVNSGHVSKPAVAGVGHGSGSSGTGAFQHSASGSSSTNRVLPVQLTSVGQGSSQVNGFGKASSSS